MSLVAYKLTISDARTDTGRRRIDLDERTIAVLRGVPGDVSSKNGCSLVQPPTTTTIWCCPAPDGTPTNPDAFSQSFDRLVARSGLPRIRLHDLRHTHASILLRAGVPVKVVSERLGHANRASRSPSTSTSFPACRPTPPPSSPTSSSASSGPLLRSATSATTSEGRYAPVTASSRLSSVARRGRQVRHGGLGCAAVSESGSHPHGAAPASKIRRFPNRTRHLLPPVMACRQVRYKIR